MALSDEHKAALAKGRRESRIIKNYLKALQARRPGRPVTPEGVRKRLSTIEDRLGTEEHAVKLLDLHQEKLDAEETLRQLEARQDLNQLEKQFVGVAKDYSGRKGISYMAWRQVGVAASVLKEAGVPRTRRG